jgi:hypothetical protein
MTHGTPGSAQVRRIDAEIPAHLAKQTFAELLLEILDGRSTGSEENDPVTAATSARVHVEGYATPPGEAAQPSDELRACHIGRVAQGESRRKCEIPDFGRRLARSDR